MRFQTPLVPGRLIQRYKRFLADVELADGTVVTAHCPNPGSMMGLKEPGLKVWLEPNNDPKKKLKYGWRVAEPGGVMVGIDTATPNRIVKEALEAGHVAEVAAYNTVRPEVKYGKGSRVDFLLTEPGLPDAYVEVKNVHLLRKDDWAEFPDSVTTRGAKHLYELSEMVAQGHRAIMLYVVQYMGCARFTLAEDLDPGYAKAYRAAREAGVEMLAYGCDVSPEEITLAGPMPVLVD